MKTETARKGKKLLASAVHWSLGVVVRLLDSTLIEAFVVWVGYLRFFFHRSTLRVHVMSLDYQERCYQEQVALERRYWE